MNNPTYQILCVDGPRVAIVGPFTSDDEASARALELLAGGCECATVEVVS